MALFEVKAEKNFKPDDTQQISCFIETVQEIDGHTEYLLRFQRGPLKENSWKLLRRYNDFVELQKCLRISRIQLPLPGKKLIGNMRPDFIAERRQALQTYINTILMNPILASSLPAKRFVDPDSYSQSFHDQAVQNASLCLRNEGIWTLGPTLGAIGWRLRKHFFQVLPKPPEKSGGSKHLVKSGSQSHQTKHFSISSINHVVSCSNPLETATLDHSELVLEWVEYGPDKFIEDKDLSSILRSLLGLKHPNIETIVFASHNEHGCLIIRKFYKEGTLKDILCMSTPKNPFLSKYGNPKGRIALTIRQVAMYGRQILEALIFLHAKGYPYGHLHSGNIVIVDDEVKLLDVENYILGVPSFYRPFFVQHGKIHSPETIDVYCFGHVLFEMAMGYPLQESIVRQINDCPDLLRNLLEMILSKDACKAGLPSLEQLSQHEFFTKYCAEPCGNDNLSNYHFKMSMNIKEIIMHASQKFENRLRDEQKLVKSQKRIVRVQEMMSSEEEKRKTKHKVKVEQKQIKLKQQNSLQTIGDGRGPLSPGSTTVETPQKSVKQQVSLSNVEAQMSSPNISSQNDNDSDLNRSALLESICKFNRGSLRKVRSND